MNRTHQLRLFCLLKIHKSEIYIKKENATYNLYAALPKDFSEKWKSDFRFIFLYENSCTYAIKCALKDPAFEILIWRHLVVKNEISKLREFVLIFLNLSII